MKIVTYQSGQDSHNHPHYQPKVLIEPNVHFERPNAMECVCECWVCSPLRLRRGELGQPEMYKAGFIYDPLGQTHSLESSDHYFHLENCFYFLRDFEKVGMETDGHYV